MIVHRVALAALTAVFGVLAYACSDNLVQAYLTADQCDPVQQVGCGDGGLCDLDQKSGYFACFSGAAPMLACGACNNSYACAAGMNCVGATNSGDGVCFRFCCTDADCGSGDVCEQSAFASQYPVADPADVIGFCVSAAGSTTAGCAVPTTPATGTCAGGYWNPDGGASGDRGDAGSPDAGGSADGGDAGGSLDAGSSADGGDAGTAVVNPGDAGGLEAGASSDAGDSGSPTDDGGANADAGA